MPQLKRWLRTSGASLELGLSVRESPGTFLLAKVGNATHVSAHLRRHDVRVRDGSSFWIAQWIRLSAQPLGAQRRFSPR